MKILLTVLVIGLFLLYIFDVAFDDVDNLNQEMITHNLVIFFASFIFLGVLVWYKRKLKLKISIYIILAFIIADDIFDYMRGIDDLFLQIIIQDFFIIIWGAISGYFFITYLHQKKSVSK